MACYRNASKGARPIHLTNGSYLLVEAGATVDVAEGKVRRLGPDIVLAENDVPPVPADVAKKAKAALDHDDNGKPGGSKKQPATGDIKALRAEYEKKLGKKPFNGWDIATLREKIGAA